MIGMMPREGIISNFTLNLLKDTGWYDVDYTNVGLF